MPTIALCMIVKNEEAFLKNAIESAKPLANEIIVVDTGSTDATRQIAQEAGATVYDFKWENDFSKARNFALSMAKSDWILVLDADEQLGKVDIEQIKKIMAAAPADVVAYAFPQRFYTPKEQSQKYGEWHALGEEEKQALSKESSFFTSFSGYYDIKYMTRLFKKTPEIFFQGKVHEDVNPSIGAWHKTQPVKTIVQTQIPLHHFHFLKSQEFVQEKQRWYFELSKEKYKEAKDPKIAIDLAVGYIIYENNPLAAFEHIKQAVQSQENFDKNKEAIISDLMAKNKQLRALNELFQMLDMTKHDTNSILNLAKAYYQIKTYRAAIIVLKKLFDENPQDPLLIEYLGVCYDHIKYTEDAIKVFEHGIIVHPNNASFYFCLGALYEKAKDLGKACAAFDRAIQVGHPMAAGIKQRIEMLKKLQSGEHAHFKITMGNV